MNEISLENLNELLDERNEGGIVPREKFMAFDSNSNHRIAVDNTSNDFRIEEFEDLEEAQARLGIY